jgi:hypothetical protein
MRLSASQTWGPHPLFAILPVVAMLGCSGWIWLANRGPLPAPSEVAIVALKPVTGLSAEPAELPIEVRYGVPTERTLHLWAPAG